MTSDKRSPKVKQEASCLTETLSTDLDSERKDGYITDYISGRPVKDGPEERDAVQVFAQMLVEDYGYPKKHIQTRPQYRVKARPSDVKKEYPIDIAVFNNAKKDDDGLFIIVECKKKERKDGETQLKDYLRFSTAFLGVWFNGQEHLFLKKIEKGGKVLFEEIPNIPLFSQRIEDVGLFKRKDLKPATNLKAVFRTVRNFLAANAVGITRDEVFAQQLINLIFCKIYDERFTKPNDMVTFRAGVGEESKAVHGRIAGLFDLVKEQYSDVIDSADSIQLDSASITHVVGTLQQYALTASDRDAVGDAFETFIGPALKGSQGQFFTPRNVVKMVIDMVDPGLSDKLIDPACGSGGFLIECLRYVWRSVEKRGRSFGWPEREIDAEKQRVAINNFRGIDKDGFLSKVAKSYMAILGDGRGGVYCENSLDNPKNWGRKAGEGIQMKSFDVVMTNPPFGKKLKIDDRVILGSFQLGHKWKINRASHEYDKTAALQKGQSPQILFIERCLNLLKDGGRLGIIVPESMLCNPSHRFIVQYIKSVARIRAVVSLPEELFQPHTHAKTCAVVIEKKLTNRESGHSIFMAVAKWCGHDSRGLPVPHDDIPHILEKFKEYRRKGRLDYDHYGFVVNEKNIKEDIYLPKYYNPEIVASLERLSPTHDLCVLGDLVKKKQISISTGHEVGKLAYGTGTIPFVRTSEIANWEVKLDPKHGLSESIYSALKEKQDVQENDILMVRDGTYLVGTCGLVTKRDVKIVYQSHLCKIRATKPDILHPFLLLAVLTSPIVKAQISAKQFTQDIIDTLGSRVKELVLPIPKDRMAREEIIKSVSAVLKYKDAARDLTRRIILDIAPFGEVDNDSEFLTMGK